MDPDQPTLTQEFLREHACRNERISELEQTIYNLLLAQSKSLVKRFRRLDAQTPAINPNPQ